MTALENRVLANLTRPFVVAVLSKASETYDVKEILRLLQNACRAQADNVRGKAGFRAWWRKSRMLEIMAELVEYAEVSVTEEDRP